MFLDAKEDGKESVTSFVNLSRPLTERSAQISSVSRDLLYFGVSSDQNRVYSKRSPKGIRSFTKKVAIFLKLIVPNVQLEFLVILQSKHIQNDNFRA